MKSKEEILDSAYWGLVENPQVVKSQTPSIIDAAYKAMEEYGRQLAIEFFKFNAKNIAEYLLYLSQVKEGIVTSTYEMKSMMYEGATIEERFDIFMQQQAVLDQFLKNDTKKPLS